MALRAAHNAGITVPASVSKRCKDYARACQRPKTGADLDIERAGSQVAKAEPCDAERCISSRAVMVAGAVHADFGFVDEARREDME